MKIKENNVDKSWEYFEESRKLLTKEDETKIFDAIMDAGAAAKIQGVELPYCKYIKQDQMERFNERLEFSILLLKKHNEKK